MTKFIKILKKEESQEALLAQLKVVWETTADDKKSEILHANNDFSFGLACDKGHLDTGQWLCELLT